MPGISAISIIPSFVDGGLTTVSSESVDLGSATRGYIDTTRACLGQLVVWREPLPVPAPITHWRKTVVAGRNRSM